MLIEGLFTASLVIALATLCACILPSFFFSSSSTSFLLQPGQFVSVDERLRQSEMIKLSVELLTHSPSKSVQPPCIFLLFFL